MIVFCSTTDQTDIVIQTEAILMQEVIDEFVCFLRACGYQLRGLEETCDDDEFEIEQEV